jgi:Leucine-rich repeat (LRR) protein
MCSGNPMGGPPEGQRIRLEELVDGHAGIDPPTWMQEILSSGVAPEASIVYLKVWLMCRGSPSLGIDASLVLDLRALCLDSLPQEVWDLHWSAKMQNRVITTEITCLLLDNNPLSNLPLKVIGWQHVEMITCNNCLLRDIPRVLGEWQHLPCLRVLEAADNGLRTFPSFDGGWTSLERLDLDRNEFVVLPPNFGFLTNLTVLTLRHNKIELLPCSLWRMKSLKVLFLHSNNLTRLPAEIGALAAVFPPVESIEMREHVRRGGPLLEYISRPPGSPLPAMPEDKIGRSTWRVSMRGLERDGESVYGSLVDFRFDDNDFFWSPPPEVQAQGKPAMYRYLRAFYDCRHTRGADLHDMGLLRLPPEVMEVAWSLQSLWLGFNDLETLPVCIEELTGLKTLHLHHNRITRLPPTVGLCLLELTDLDISHNQMQRLPLEFANLKKLVNFELRNNPWEMIPEVCTLACLQRCVLASASALCFDL